MGHGRLHGLYCKGRPNTRRLKLKSKLYKFVPPLFSSSQALGGYLVPQDNAIMKTNHTEKLAIERIERLIGESKIAWLKPEVTLCPLALLITVRIRIAVKVVGGQRIAPTQISEEDHLIVWLTLPVEQVADLRMPDSILTERLEMMTQGFAFALLKKEGDSIPEPFRRAFGLEDDELPTS